MKSNQINRTQQKAVCILIPHIQISEYLPFRNVLTPPFPSALSQRIDIELPQSPCYAHIIKSMEYLRIKAVPGNKPGRKPL